MLRFDLDPRALPVDHGIPIDVLLKRRPRRVVKQAALPATSKDAQIELPVVIRIGGVFAGTYLVALVLASGAQLAATYGLHLAIIARLEKLAGG